VNVWIVNAQVLSRYFPPFCCNLQLAIAHTESPRNTYFHCPKVQRQPSLVLIWRRSTRRSSSYYIFPPGWAISTCSATSERNRVRLRQFTATRIQAPCCPRLRPTFRIRCDASKMFGNCVLSTFLPSLLPALLLQSPAYATEQQPFQFEAMSAPSYTLPPLPYAYDVSSSSDARCEDGGVMLMMYRRWNRTSRSRLWNCIMASTIKQ
jgi:hypothetical protein